MKRFLTTIFSVFISTMLLNAQITNPAPYCQSEFMFNYNMFDYIKISGTTKSLGPMGSVGSSSTYLYHNTTVFPTVAAGSPMTIELMPYSPNDLEPMYFAVFIDYNNDNTFSPSEIVMQNNNTTNAALPTWGAPTAAITKTITIPAGTANGLYRLRLIRSGDGGFTYNNAYTINPCNNPAVFEYGCTHDFDINISAVTTIPVTSVTVSSAGNATTVLAGSTLQMNASVLPINATNNTVTWSVQNGTGTASISATGLLTGLTPGTVTVVATSNGTPSVFGTKQITVNANNIPVNSITVTSTANATTVPNGATLQMFADVLPLNASNNTVTWSVQNGTGSGTISTSGLLTGTAVGTVTVVATSNSNPNISGTKIITVTVPTIPVTSIVVSSAGNATTVFKNSTLQMSAAVLPTNPTNGAFTWSVQNGTGAATISSTGLLTGTVAGTVIVKATSVSTPTVFGTKQITVLNVTSVDNIESSDLVIFPNPTHNFINIQNALNETITKVNITNTFGQLVFSSTDQFIKQIDLSKFATGTYFINIFTNKGNSNTFKISKL
ncbi:MAG: Ig-like domain-containing protein [Chitinophagaceae bacterium]